MGEVAERVQRRCSAEPENILMITSQGGFVPQSEKYDRFMAGESLKNYIELRQGEFAYNKGNSKAYPQGCVYQLREWTSAAVPNVYICFAIEAERLDHEFASQFFLGGGLNDQLKRVITSGVRGNGLLNISADDFFRSAVPLPPLAEQKKIAAILSSVDEAIQASEAVIEQTRRVKDGLLDEVLTRGLEHTAFKETSIGDIPRHWEIATPGELAAFTGGYGFRPPDWSAKGLPIIRIQNLNGNAKFNYYDGPARDEWIVEPGDLLFAWAGSAGASFGPCIWPGPRGVLNQHIYKLRVRPGVDARWLYAVMRLITSRVEQRAHGFKSTLLHVHKSDITDQPIPLPPYEEQAAIAERLEALSGAVESGESELAQLRQVKAGLLQDLLTGKVRVST